jgi:hypothetical protein
LVYWTVSRIAEFAARSERGGTLSQGPALSRGAIIEGLREEWSIHSNPFRRIFIGLLEDADYFRFRLSPNVSISVGARVKIPGEAMVGEVVELLVRQSPADEMTPYERLLGDAIRGDPALFVREDGVEAAWSVVDPILRNVTPIHEYEPNSWRPIQADQFIAGNGGWRNPQPVLDEAQRRQKEIKE